MNIVQKRIHKNIINTSLIFIFIIGIILLIISLTTPLPYYLALTFVISGLISVLNYIILIYKTEQSVDHLLKKTVKFLSLIKMGVFLLGLLGLFFLFKQDKWVVFTFLLGYLVLKLVIIVFYGVKKKE